MIKVAPSLLSLDFANAKEDLLRVSAASIYHYDVMDGHFVKNISFGSGILKNLRPYIKGIISTHLMIEHPEDYYQDFIDNGSDALTIHYEVPLQPKELQNLIIKIRQQVPIGLSIKPNTSVEVIIPYLKDLDHVLIMSVEPGWGGQKFMESALDKIQFLAKYRKEHHLNFTIEVDGGVSLENSSKIIQAGVDTLVMGSNLFKSSNPLEIIKHIESIKA